MFVKPLYIRSFLLGGNCRCMIGNQKTGNCFSYHIKQGSKRLYFVNVETPAGRVYAGYIQDMSNKEGHRYMYVKGTNGAMSESLMPIQALLYVLNRADCLPAGVYVEHYGKCGVCGRKLTDPESMERGIGPNCIKKLVK